jgi:hypothetical protein
MHPMQFQPPRRLILSFRSTVQNKRLIHRIPGPLEAQKRLARRRHGSLSLHSVYDGPIAFPPGLLGPLNGSSDKSADQSSTWQEQRQDAGKLEEFFKSLTRHTGVLEDDGLRDEVGRIDTMDEQETLRSKFNSHLTRLALIATDSRGDYSIVRESEAFEWMTSTLQAALSEPASDHNYRLKILLEEFRNLASTAAQHSDRSRRYYSRYDGDVEISHHESQARFQLLLFVLSSTRHFQSSMAITPSTTNLVTSDAKSVVYSIQEPYATMFEDLPVSVAFSAQFCQHLRSLDDRSLGRLVLHVWQSSAGEAETFSKAAYLFENQPVIPERTSSSCAEWTNLLVAVARAVSSVSVKQEASKITKFAVKRAYKILRELRGEKEALAFAVQMWKMRLGHREDQLCTLLPLVLDRASRSPTKSLQMDEQRLEAIQWFVRTYDKLRVSASQAATSSPGLRRHYEKATYTICPPTGSRRAKTLATRDKTVFAKALAWLASDVAINSSVAAGSSYKFCERCRHMLILFGSWRAFDSAKIVARAMVWSGIIRPLVSGRGLEPEKTSTILSIVSEVEGQAIADELDAVIVQWQTTVRETRPNTTTTKEDSMNMRWYHSNGGLVDWILDGSKDVKMISLDQTRFSDENSAEMARKRWLKYLERMEWNDENKRLGLKISP